MYVVSDAFLRAVKAKTRSYYWSGVITTAGGGEYEFGPEDIVKGSGHISAQCCGSTELELGTVYAAEFGISLFSAIDAMPNGTELFSIYPENDIETCRDVLFYVGQILAGFFVINREGKLEIRRYGTEPVETYEAKHRFSSSFSDFVTEYSAVSSTNNRTEIAEYYALEDDRKLAVSADGQRPKRGASSEGCVQHASFAGGFRCFLKDVVHDR